MRVGGRGERREKQERGDGGIFAGLGHFGDHPTPEERKGLALALALAASCDA